MSKIKNIFLFLFCLLNLFSVVSFLILLETKMAKQQIHGFRRTSAIHGLANNLGRLAVIVTHNMA